MYMYRVFDSQNGLCDLPLHVVVLDQTARPSILHEARQAVHSLVDTLAERDAYVCIVLCDEAISVFDLSSIQPRLCQSPTIEPLAHTASLSLADVIAPTRAFQRVRMYRFIGAHQQE
jgi:hypothetical protein